MKRYCMFCGSTRLSRKGVWVNYNAGEKILITVAYKCRSCRRQVTHQFMEDKKKAKGWRIA